jgi:glutamate formiminotransferase/formiminotetrahydrofolate cyclodeaminase
VPESELIETAIQSLGLRELGGFDPAQKIIEYRVASPAPLASASVRAFTDLTSSESPVPGGGSVSALCGALAAALTAMVANLTFGKKGYEGAWEQMSTVAAQAQEIKDEFLRAVDEDSRAFESVMAANRLPKSTPEEEARRSAAVQDATKQAIEAPLTVMRACERVLPLLESVAEKGNRNSISDAGVAALALRTASGGAFLNVLINIAGIEDRKYADAALREARGLLDAVSTAAPGISDRIKRGLGA